jgi:hypothetical protein
MTTQKKRGSQPTGRRCRGHESWFWVSWYQPTGDMRPLTFPPVEGIIGWWCSGQRYDDDAWTIVALVVAKSECSAKRLIRKSWPEASEWRGCDEVSIGYQPGDRFPLSEWMSERHKLEATK